MLKYLPSTICASAVYLALKTRGKTPWTPDLEKHSTYKEADSDKLLMDIHFWLGENVSQDEQGVAAYKTVELDEHLGGAAIQHREVQGYESEQFMQLFKKVEYLKGGVASGFTHVERDSYETRLLRLKGSRSVRVATMELSSASLNSGDVFVLDMGLKLIQWNGAEANKKEKAKALDVQIGRAHV